MANTTAILAAVGGVVVLLAGIAGVFYFTDSPVTADVIDADCSLSQSEITVKTRFPIPGVTRQVEVDASKCTTVAGLIGKDSDSDPYAKYYLKSECLQLWDADPDQGGKKIVDTC